MSASQTILPPHGRRVGPQGQRQSRRRGRVVTLSPHPDDEVIAQGGAFRRLLQSEPRVRITNYAMTFGSAKERKKGRRQELLACADFMGITARANDFDLKDPAAREGVIAMVTSYLSKDRPSLVFFPAREDDHGTHRAVHEVGTEATRRYSLEYPQETIAILQTFVWGVSSTQNLFIGHDQATFEWKMDALRWHVGEFERMPYDKLMRGLTEIGTIWGSEKCGAKMGGGFAGDPYAEMFYSVTLQNGQMRQNKPIFLTTQNPLTVEGIVRELSAQLLDSAR